MHYCQAQCQNWLQFEPEFDENCVYRLSN